MGAMTKSMMVVFVAYLVLILAGVVTVPGSALWTLMFNPTNWESLSFISLISDALLAGGAALAVGGTIFGNDTATFAGISGVFFSMGAGLMELFIIIKNTLGSEVAMIAVSPLILIFIMAIMAFWRRGD